MMVRSNNSKPMAAIPALRIPATEYWGLKYQKNHPYKLCIEHIHKMKPYEMLPGAYKFRSHPVYKVDIAGYVVSVSENSSFHIYGIDDSTGVINACYLNEDRDTQPPTARSKFSLGDYLHICGKIQEFRDKKEIFANTCVRIEDPNYESQRMCEQTHLYKNIYLLSFRMPEKIRLEIKKYDSGKAGICHVMSDEILRPIMEKCGCFRIDDLIADGKLTDLAPGTSVVDLRKALVFIIQRLILDGTIYLLTTDEQKSYQLRDGLNCKLCQTITAILKSEVKPKGWHYCDVWNKLQDRHRHLRHVKQITVLKSLESLVHDSLVISPVTHHFMLLDDS